MSVGMCSHSAYKRCVYDCKTVCACVCVCCMRECACHACGCMLVCMSACVKVCVLGWLYHFLLCNVRIWALLFYCMHAFWHAVFALHSITWLHAPLCYGPLGGSLCIIAQWLRVLALVFVCLVLAFLCCVLCVMLA